MYDELVKRLREEASSWCINCCYRAGDCICGAPDDRKNDCDIASKLQAADAIEELSAYKKIALDEHNRAAKKAWEHRWIPVAERLPEHECGESTSVLTVDLYGVMRVAYFDGGNWCWPTGEALTTMQVAPITHWMPLPEPPKEESL